MTHICVSRVTIIGSDNGLSPGWRQAIIWTNAGILLTGPLGTNFSGIVIEVYIFLFKKCITKRPSAKCQPFWLCFIDDVTGAQIHFLNLTVTSKWARWRLKSPAFRLFTQPLVQAEIKDIKDPRQWPLWGEFTGDRRIPLTKGQSRGKCFHLMTPSWTAWISKTLLVICFWG